MPLNPPSWHGHDVWYSPNVFINKAQTALWQPPQPYDEIPTVADISWVRGCSIITDGSGGQIGQAQAYLQQQVASGNIPQSELDRYNNANGSAANQSNTTPAPSTPPPAVNTDTQGVQNLTTFPSNLQLSKYYTLAQLTERPSAPVSEQVPDSGWGGLTKGQIVANLKLLAQNILDPIRERYPDSFVTNTFRKEASNGKNQHPLGQAADVQFSQTPKSKYYDIAVWVKDNLQYDQLILEYSGKPSCWLHISWNPKGNRPPGPYKAWTMLAPAKVVNANGLVNMAGQLGLP